MRILLDENLPKRLRFRLVSRIGISDVKTVREMNWNGRKNGELLGLLTFNGFEVLITADKSLYKQQNLDKFAVTVIVLNVRTTKYQDIQPILPKLYDLLDNLPIGKVIIIDP